MKQCGFLHDHHGNRSSKRLWGSIILGLGLILAVVLFGYSLIDKASDSQTALSIIHIFFLTGGSLLGLGIAERHTDIAKDSNAIMQK